MTIPDNFKDIHARIDKVAAHHDAPRDKVHLIAVSKIQPDERIDAALDHGHRLYGENRVQEAQTRWGSHDDESSRRGKHSDLDLHLIGPLQTNKAKDAVALFDAIHTLDREKLARSLDKEMIKQGRNLPCFIQVNTGAEDQKAGILPDDLGGFVDFVKIQTSLNIVGLMCIPPVHEPAGLHFAFLNELADKHSLTALSIGMSADFERAIPFAKSEKDIYIRLGSAVFGAREHNK